VTLNANWRSSSRKIKEIFSSKPRNPGISTRTTLCPALSRLAQHAPCRLPCPTKRVSKGNSHLTPDRSRLQDHLTSQAHEPHPQAPFWPMQELTGRPFWSGFVSVLDSIVHGAPGDAGPRGPVNTVQHPRVKPDGAHKRWKAVEPGLD